MIGKPIKYNGSVAHEEQIENIMNNIFDMLENAINLSLVDKIV